MIRLRVARKQTLARNVVGLTLEGDALPLWTPGAHIDLHLPGGLVRQYSLCGDPADPGTWRVAVLREPDGRGGSAAVHDVLAVGDTLTADGPRNRFPLADAERYLFLAGGIGITPILPMVAEVARRRRPWQLAYGGRSLDGMAFRNELSRWQENVALYSPGRMDLDRLLGAVTNGTAVYCCGPASLLEAVEKRAAAVHTEHFTAGRLTATKGEAANEFEVELASTGQVITVPADGSVLAALRGAGREVLSSCEEGTCGTCETGVLGGVPDHRDTVLTPAEQAKNDVMMICVSRARTPRLVLDL
jgi:ferredoxin-NADP reductase